MYTTDIFSQHSYQAESDHFIYEETMAPIGETNCPVISHLVNGRARFQVL